MPDVAPAAHSPPRLIVIGASAGGLAPLRAIVGALPADFPATVLVVMHLSPTAKSFLAEILARVTEAGVAPAADDLELRPGRIFVAPPDRHLTVLAGRIQLTRGPRENGHRPAVDPLFRSAAEQYGPACCGVILSGTRDDGTAGLAEIKAHGGVTVVQDPSEAQYDGMPAHALAATDADFVLPAEEIGPTLVRLARSELQVERFGRAPAGGNGDGDPELLSILCPECGGSLVQDDEMGVAQFRCHVGHRYSLRNLLAAHAETVERALWTAVRSLEDRASLLRRMARRAAQSGSTISAARFEAQAHGSERQAESIRVAIAALDDGGLEPPLDASGVSS
jgi:two-component system chemotaxis response regulator CheB